MSEEIKFDIPNYAIPNEIKEICRECEYNIHCQNKGCAFRSLGNEYCDKILNATGIYLKLQQENHQLKDRINNAIEYCKNDDNFRLSDLYSQSIADEIQKDLLDLLKGDKK